MDSIIKNSKKKLAHDCICGALIGAISCIGGASFFELYVIASFHEYSRFPYAYVLSFVSIFFCTVFLVLLMYKWVVSYLKEDKKSSLLVCLCSFFYSGDHRRISNHNRINDCSKKVYKLLRIKGRI